MNFDDKLFAITAVFAGFLFLIVFKKLLEFHKEGKREQLSLDAQQYFVPLCHKLLTPFGSEQDAAAYYTFFLSENYLRVEYCRRTNPIRGKNLNVETFLSVTFTGSAVYNHRNHFVFSPDEFERYLSGLFASERVHSVQIEEMWNELQKRPQIK